MVKEQYFARMSLDLYPDRPGYRESRWIASEDVNVEHLLDAFVTIETDTDDVWDACTKFMEHLYRRKWRLTILGPKTEGLADNHRSKPKCLFWLSQTFHRVGNYMEYKRLLTDTLKLNRERGDCHAVARTLNHFSHASYHMGFYEEGIREVEDALEIFKQLGDTVGQAECLMDTARLLYSNEQPDVAEEAAFCAIDLLSGKGERYLVCESHCILGDVYRSKGDTGKAIHHVLGIASSFGWDDQLFWGHCNLVACLFLEEDRFDDAQTHVERAKPHAVNSTYLPGHAMEVQATLWRKQGGLGEARSAALRAADVYEKPGAARGLEGCRNILRGIEGE